MTRDRIFEEIWGDYGSDFSFESDTINVHISYLRKKLGPTLIRTIKLV
ncbi:MAG: winged helix-turn-helix domain-containing protein [Patescibacteria group bacterium]